MSDHHILLVGLFVQIAVFVGLAVYTFETYKIRMASQRATQAAVDAALASIKQAVVAEENLRLLKGSYEEKIGEGPTIVLEAIQRAKTLIAYWRVQAAHIPMPPQGTPRHPLQTLDCRLS